VIVAFGTIVQDYRFNTSIAREHTTTLAIDGELGRLESTVAELRGAQAAYVAAGQVPDFWTSRVTDLSSLIGTSLQRFSDATVSVEARGRYEEATTALGELLSLDARAREQVSRDQRLFAADIIFMDAVEVAKRLNNALAGARAAETAAGTAAAQRLASLRLGMNALALGFVLVVMVYFARAGSDASADGSLALDSPEGEKAAEAESTARLAPPPARAPAPAPAPSLSPPLPRAEPAVSLSGAADLCVDLARLMDSRDLPDLMERAARVLYAKGVVLWMVDSDGAFLQPTIAHGYSERVLARLGSLQVDADNVTSLAYRTLQPQRMKSAEKGGAGAVAVPLINAGGGIGVLSAEMKSATPDDQMIAVARIVAAQLSSLLAPANAEARAAEA
jgi:hypothetical protein